MKNMKKLLQTKKSNKSTISKLTSSKEFKILENIWKGIFNKK